MRGGVQSVSCMYGPEWLQPRQMHGILSGLQRLQAGMGTNRVVMLPHNSTEFAYGRCRLTKDGQTVSAAVKRQYKK